MTATAERTTAAASSVPTELWEMGRSSLSTFFWAQDQAENLVRTWMDQVRTTRHDGQRVLETLMSQAQSNSEELYRMAEENSKNALRWNPAWVTFTNR